MIEKNEARMHVDQGDGRKMGGRKIKKERTTERTIFFGSFIFLPRIFLPFFAIGISLTPTYSQ